MLILLSTFHIFLYFCTILGNLVVFQLLYTESSLSRNNMIRKFKLVIDE